MSTPLRERLPGIAIQSDQDKDIQRKLMADWTAITRAWQDNSTTRAYFPQWHTTWKHGQRGKEQANSHSNTGRSML